MFAQSVPVRNEVLRLSCRGKRLTFEHPVVMGIINATPDSFSDGGQFFELQDALSHAFKMIESGAQIIDIGGETTKPNSDPTPEAEELRRVIPLIEKIRERESSVIISIDTNKSKVAAKALEQGADIINDISSLRFDEGMVDLLLDYPDVPIILMHMQGTPRTMQANPQYDDVVSEIKTFFSERISYCLSKGIAQDRIVLDPGIGFGKNIEHNLEILRRLDEFHTFGVPILLGASRKRFINRIYPSEPQGRIVGSLAITALAYYNKIQIVRVHDVLEHVQLLKTFNAIYDQGRE
ncbi:MAG: dihydropteroate synthase [Candidatus Cloacimonadia bacterium]